jgi:single-stranded-DNA-specific exonuclease
VIAHRWLTAPSQPALADFLARELSVSPLLAQCLLNRGVSEPDPARRFLRPRLKDLADPFLIPNMDKAVDRLFRAREAGEHIVVFGDYDVDGVTSTALLMEVLEKLGWKLNYYLPHRLDEGYGLSQEGIENCLKKFPASLVLAVDCGSTAIATINWLAQSGIDVLVLDHHQVSNPAPAATALVNPQLGSTEGGRFRELCSAGLAFKLAHAITKRGREMGLVAAMELDLRPLLDLVALGTIADLVPLKGENRILVSAGLERLNTTSRPGLVALKSVAQVAGEIGVYEVGFQLAPRLNAAGRLENAVRSLQLLLADDLAEAEPIARELDAQNRERQQIERTIVEEVLGTLRAKFNPELDYVIVEGRLLWHVGVVGIVASRVVREFYRPTIIVGGEGVEWKGSGRSIEGFDLAAALRSCEDLLVRHGGHALAAGLTVQADRVEALRCRLNDLARRTLNPEYLQPVLRIDAEITLADITIDSLNELQQLGPLGQGNPPVQLLVRNVVQQRPLQRMGKERQHAKLWITDGQRTHEAVWWNCPPQGVPEARFDLAFAPQINEFNGRQITQLKVLDWRVVRSHFSGKICPPQDSNES